MVNVGKYSIHGLLGFWLGMFAKPKNKKPWRSWQTRLHLMYAPLACQKGQSNSSSNTLDWPSGSMSCNVYLPMVSSGRTSPWRPDCIDPPRQHIGLPLAQPFCKIHWATDEITRLGKMPSPNVGGGPFGCAVFWTWIKGYRCWEVPFCLRRFPGPLQSSRQLLTTLFIH